MRLRLSQRCSRRAVRPLLSKRALHTTRPVPLRLHLQFRRL